PALASLGRQRLRHLARLLRELDREHRAEAPDLANRSVLLGHPLEPAADQAADRFRTLAEARFGQSVEHDAGRGARDWVAAERAAQATGMHRVHQLGASRYRCQRESAS